MDPIFVKPSASYPAYQDFWELVRLSGFPTVSAKDVRFCENSVHIWSALDAEMMSVLSEAGPRSTLEVFWNLERPDANLRGNMDPLETFRKGNGEILDWVDAVWVSDRMLQGADQNTTYAVLGSHPGLRKTNGNRCLYHAVHMGQSTPRRAKVLDQLQGRGLTFVSAGWGEAREKALSDSRLMVSIGRVEGLKIASVLRWAVAAAYSLPIVSEAVSDPYPLCNSSLIQAPYEKLSETVMERLSDTGLQEIGDRAHEALCRDWTFRKGVEDALGRTA